MDPQIFDAILGLLSLAIGAVASVAWYQITRLGVRLDDVGRSLATSDATNARQDAEIKQAMLAAERAEMVAAASEQRLEKRLESIEAKLDRLLEARQG